MGAGFITSHSNLISISKSTVVHCKNKIVKITNSFVGTVASNNGNFNLISRVASYDCMVTYKDQL